MVVYETVVKTSGWKPQTQQPLFAWCPVQFQWMYRFFFSNLQKLRCNLGPSKLIKIEIKALKITLSQIVLFVVPTLLS